MKSRDRKCRHSVSGETCAAQCANTHELTCSHTGMEYFENSAKHASAEKKRNPITCANTHPVRYKFTQGLTNAIKRPVSIKDLMA